MSRTQGPSVRWSDGDPTWVSSEKTWCCQESWHPVADDGMVVEQSATWPGSAEAEQVSNLFHVKGDKVATARRLGNLSAGLTAAAAYKQRMTGIGASGPDPIRPVGRFGE